MATADEVISQVLRRLDEQSTSAPVRWTRAEILVYLNDAIQELNLIALEIQNTVSLSVTTTDNVYDVPATVIALLAIHIANRYLKRTTVNDLDHDFSWEKSDAVAIQPGYWAPLGLNKVIVAKRPRANVTAYLEALVLHTAVTDAAVALPVRSEYVPILEDYCVERATFREGGYELNHAEQFYTNFLNVAQELSGRNVIAMYPRYTYGGTYPEQLREELDESPRGQNEAGGR